MGFDDLAAAGRAAVPSGNHEVESPPEAEGLRWGPSVILHPDADTRSRVDGWVSELLPIVGPGHWATGSSASAHITVRTLGPRRRADSDDGMMARYAEAVAAAADAVDSVRFQLGRVLLSPISVMLALLPVDDAADRLAAAIEQALGPDGWFERNRVRDIWYLNLVHFTGLITDANGLAQWVDTCDAGKGCCVDAHTLEAVHWEFNGRQMIPTPLARVSLGRAAEP